MKPLFYKCVLVAFWLSVLPESVSAHKVKIFASAEGSQITGYVYYTGGGAPKQALILVQDQDGNELGELHTDENGEFSFSADARQDHLFILELADGHRASFTVKAEELPGSLEGTKSAISQPRDADDTGERGNEKTSGTDEPVASVQEQVTLQVSAEQLENLIEEAVSKQIRPLREQLDRYEEKVRLHDILGGIGYIAGLMGLGYFLSSRKAR